MKKLSRILASERHGLKPTAQDSLSGWGLAGVIAGVSAGSLVIGTVTGRIWGALRAPKIPTPEA